MTSGATSPRELTVSGSTLLHIRQILADEVDSATVTRMLYDMGFATGESVFDDFSASTGADPRTFGHDHFWTDLGQFLSAHRWGNFSHERIHPGLGMVRTEQWGESGPAVETNEPSCAFTSGMFSRVFTRIAGSPIAVLEVSCRSRGDHDCSFTFGSEQAVGRLRGLLLENNSLDTALDLLS